MGNNIGPKTIKGLSINDAVIKFGWGRYNPTQVEITLTFKCNLRCIHCYNENISGTNSSLKTLIASVYKEYRNGARFLTISGGEPTLYPELDKFISIANKIGYKYILLLTNGINLDYDYLKRLYESGLNIIKFSIHSDVEEIHDKITGVMGSYKKLLCSIENAIKIGFYVEGNTVVSRYNYRTLPSLMKFLTHIYGISTCIMYPHYYGNAKSNIRDIAIRYSQHIYHLKKALDILYKSKVKPSCHPIGNYPPCILPGYEHLIQDWKNDGNILSDTCYIDEDKNTICNIRSAEKIKLDVCNRCIYDNICLGVDREYIEIFGEDEFKPLKNKKSPFKLDSYYYPLLSS